MSTPQVTAAARVGKDVAAGALPRETGVMMLVQFFRMSQDTAEQMMGTTGAGFRPADSAALSAEAGKAGKAAGGGAGLAPAERVASTALAELLAGNGLEDWFKPLSVALSAVLEGNPDEAEFKARMGRVLARLPGIEADMDSSLFQEVLAKAIYTGAASGAAGAARGLR